MMTLGPGIMRFHYKGRNNPASGRVEAQFQLTCISPGALPPPLQDIPPHLTWAHWPNRSRVSVGLPVLFCHDCCEQGRSGWVHLAYHGPLQGRRGGSIRKPASKGAAEGEECRLSAGCSRQIYGAQRNLAPA